jgi:hypothetical protein
MYVLEFAVILYVRGSYLQIYYLHAIRLLGNLLRNFILSLLADDIYGFVLFVGRGALEWRLLECLVVALFLVNHLLTFMV